MWGTLQLAKIHNIKAKDVEKIKITTTSHLAYTSGTERKRFPQTVSDALYSFYYPVAAALVKGKLWIEDFTEEAIRDTEVLEVCRTIEVVTDPEKDRMLLVLPPTDVEIETKDGKHYKKTNILAIPGHPDEPASMADVIQKLRNCVPFSVKPLPADIISRIIQMVENLDDIEDMTTILDCLS